MKERPLIMYSHEVRATLDGRQTQFRRVIKPQPYGGYDPSLNKDGLWEWCADLDPEDAPGTGPRKCPYGVPGDRLWVKETFSPDWTDHVIYKADGGSAKDAGYASEPKWRPTIHMPRWASRITLEVVNVRAERLQEISEEDAITEGCIRVERKCWAGFIRLNGKRVGISQAGEFPPTDMECAERDDIIYPAKNEFKSLWDSINGKKYPWSDNPWVWVEEFKRINS